MQNYTTIIGVIDMRERGISTNGIQSRYSIGSSTLTLIMSCFRDCGKDLNTLKQMNPPEVEELFYPKENILRKDIKLMPDYESIYQRLTAPSSKANLFYMWLKYKQDCPAGYQYTQFCKHFKTFA